MVMWPTYAFSSGQSAQARSIGFAEEISPTLKGEAGGNTVPTIAFAANQRDELRDLGDKSGALQAEPGMKQQTFVIQSATMPSKSQNGLGITDGACYTLDCRADHAVAQPIAFDGYNQTVSNTAQTIRSNKNDGDHVGMVLQPVVAYPNPANTLLAKANMSFRGDTDNIVAQAVDVRNLRETEELSGTLQAKENGGYSLNYTNPVRIGYAVRRLTPVECLRLQGFPDNWLDIEGASDSVKYKAIGNSVAVPCVEFIFSQIVKVLERK